MFRETKTYLISISYKSYPTIESSTINCNFAANRGSRFASVLEKVLSQFHFRIPIPIGTL